MPPGPLRVSKIAFFLSGHGFGHGVRNCALINALPVRVEISLFTSLPEGFFREELRRPFRYIFCELDCGCAQTDTVSVDVEATLERYRVLDSRREETLAAFAPKLARLGADLVIGDIPPLAFPIAKAAGVPAWSLGNFTWLDIYRPYARQYPMYRDMIYNMEDDYAQAGIRIRLYPSVEGSHPGPWQDVGLLCRPGSDRREEFAFKFGLDPDKRWCLVYVGSFGLEAVAWERLRLFPDWEFIGLYPLRNAASNYHVLKKDPSYSFADLTASCDLVLGKLGYSLVAECLAHAKPVLFLGREDFAEFPLLKEVVESRGLGREISLDRFCKLDFGGDLETLAGRDISPMKATGLRDILAKMGFSEA